MLHFTDADGKRWQQVKKAESALFPDEAANFVVVGVAVDDVEGWLSLDTSYAAQTLSLTVAEIEDEAHGGGRIKKALRAIRRPDEKLSQTVARFVADVPVDVFRRWLKDPALEDFYQACRAAAKRADCDTPNELDLPE